MEPRHLLAWIVIGILSSIMPCATLEPTIIAPTTENITHVPIGQNLQIVCQGDKPLRWSHTSFENSSTIREFTESERLIDRNDNLFLRNFLSTLSISNVSKLDAGHFVCSYDQRSQISSEEQEVWMEQDVLTVHVIEQEKLMVPISPSSHTVKAYVGQEVVLPCRGIVQQVKVEILDKTRTQILSDERDYSMLQGIKIRVVGPSIETYICRATYQGRTEEMPIFVHSTYNHTNVELFAKPKITVTNNGAIYTGENFTIRCDTEQFSHVQYTLDISVPITLQPNGRVVTTSGHGPQKQDMATWFSQISIHNATVRDFGNYTCTVRSACGNHNSSVTKQVHVSEKEQQSFLDVTVQERNVTVSAGTTAKWKINIASYPKYVDPSCCNPKGESVESGAGKYKLANTSVDGEFTFEIYNVSLEDTGEYMFQIGRHGTNIIPTVVNLYLTVVASPTISMKPQLNCIFGSICTLQCTVTAYPPANIYWTFQPCNFTSSCEPPQEVKEISGMELDHVSISMIKFLPEEHGIYRCAARNYLDQTFKTTQVRVVDYLGDNPIAVMTQPEDVVEGGNVKLICALSKLGYANVTINWFQVLSGNFTRLIEAPNVKKYETRWSKRAVLEMKNVQLAETGTYMCASDGSDPLEAIVNLHVLHATVYNKIIEAKKDQTSFSLIKQLVDVINEHSDYNRCRY